MVIIVYLNCQQYSICVLYAGKQAKHKKTGFVDIILLIFVAGKSLALKQFTLVTSLYNTIINLRL